jgi:hypothetical protein
MMTKRFLFGTCYATGESWYRVGESTTLRPVAGSVSNKRVADWLLALISTLVQKDIPCNTVTHVGRIYFVENFLHRTMKNSPGSVAVPSAEESVVNLCATCTEGQGECCSQMAI